MSVGKLYMLEFYIIELYHLTAYSQLRSSICTGTGLKPTRDLAVLEITEEPPALEKALPGLPPFTDSCSLGASWMIRIGLSLSISKLTSS